MFAGNSLLLTRDGYRFLSDITEPVEIISEYTHGGVLRSSFQIATVTPMFRSRVAKITTRSGRPITFDYGSGYFLANLKTIRRERWTHKALNYGGEWLRWKAIVDANLKVVMSREAADVEFSLTEDDWAFYAYGYTDIDDPELAFPLPIPQAIRANVKYKPYVDRRQEWPSWYWQCTFAEKALFLRGIYDAYGRVTKTRVYFSAPNDTYAQQMVIALSEFGIKASRFITEQVTWKRAREYIVDVRNAHSLQRMAQSFYWAEPQLPSYRVSEVHRHANKFYWANPSPTSTEIRTVVERMPQEMIYRLEVATSHNAIINGLIVRDSLGAYE